MRRQVSRREEALLVAGHVSAHRLRATAAIAAVAVLSSLFSITVRADTNSEGEIVLAACLQEGGHCRGVEGNFGTSIKANVPGKVIEFYNSLLDHYFITADANEAAAIDAGGAGPGWKRTGGEFAAGGAVPVCRFYGSISPGPNSHFYTASPEECQGLKDLQAITPATQKRWNFEHNDFWIDVTVNGACGSGTVPVFRAYNNGQLRGVDSNHRITADLHRIEDTLARGWVYEGVVMCAHTDG